MQEVSCFQPVAQGQLGGYVGCSSSQLANGANISQVSESTVTHGRFLNKRNSAVAIRRKYRWYLEEIQVVFLLSQWLKNTSTRNTVS